MRQERGADESGRERKGKRKGEQRRAKAKTCDSLAALLSKHRWVCSADVLTRANAITAQPHSHPPATTVTGGLLICMIVIFLSIRKQRRNCSPLFVRANWRPAPVAPKILDLGAGVLLREMGLMRMTCRRTSKSVR